MRFTPVHVSFGWRSQFALLAVIWGSSFLFIKVLDRHWPALWVAFTRIALGTLVIVALVHVRRERLPRDGRLWLHCAVAGALVSAIPWTLFAYGEKHTSSIVAGLWNATTPLWALAVTLVGFGDDRTTLARGAGLMLGFLGVTFLLGPWRGLGGGQLLGHLACAGAAVCYGIGFHYTRRNLSWREHSGIVISACELICATLMLAALIPFSGPPGSHVRLDEVGSLIGLGAFSSGVAFALNFAIIRARGATVAATVTYVIPVVSTALGAAVLGEQLHWNQPVGALVLLLGIAVSQGRLMTRALPARAHPERAGS